MQKAASASVVGYEGKTAPVLGSAVEFGFLPVPSRVRYNSEKPFVFGPFLLSVFTLVATVTAANIYYVQPILVQMSEYFNVEYDVITKVPSLSQAGYCVGLVFITPLADFVPRRPFLLLLVFLTAALSLGLALTPTLAGFEALAFLVGLFTVAPQVMIPLAADLAPAHRRSSYLSVVVSGLLTGLLFGRVVSGIIARWSSFKNVFYMAAALQFFLVILMFWTIPQYPVKNRTTLTFLLSAAPFHYNTFDIGLFGLCGIGSIVVAPFVGKLCDRILPWNVTMLGVVLQMCTAAIATGGAALSLGPVIVVCFHMMFVFLGQTTGSSGFSKIYLEYGWRACYGASTAMAFGAVLVLLARGPHTKKSWFGWGGDYTLRKQKAPEVEAGREDVESATAVTSQEQAAKDIEKEKEDA
ncbi:major facilitator superfamily protein [Pseudohyphozyma bogoriensis]|nr:major facilitator superfamily protein [Pseudohyphozyma bogoriensis]